MTAYMLSTTSAPAARGFDLMSLFMLLGALMVILVPIIIVISIKSSVKRGNRQRAMVYEEELQDILDQLRRAKENGVEIPPAEKARLIEREHQLVLSLKTKYKGLTRYNYSNFGYPYDY